MFRRMMRRPSSNIFLLGIAVFWLCGLAAQNWAHNDLSAAFFYVAELIMVGGFWMSELTKL